MARKRKRRLGHIMKTNLNHATAEGHAICVTEFQGDLSGRSRCRKAVDHAMKSLTEHEPVLPDEEYRS